MQKWKKDVCGLEISHYKTLESMLRCYNLTANTYHLSFSSRWLEKERKSYCTDQYRKDRNLPHKHTLTHTHSHTLIHSHEANGANLAVQFLPEVL